MALMLMVGLCGGAVIALFSGGQRTESAYPRFFSAYNGADALIFVNGSPRVEANELRSLAALPGVVSASLFSGYNLSAGTVSIVPVGTVSGSQVNVPKVLQGRLPAAGAPLEIAVNFTFADSHHIAVGEHYPLMFLSSQPEPSSSDGATSAATTERVAGRFVMDVVGITASPLEFPPIATGQGDEILMSPSFVHYADPKLGEPQVGLAVRLRGGLGAVKSYQAEIYRGFPHVTAFAQDAGPQTAAINSAIRPEALALWLLAACLSVVGALVLLQLLARQSTLNVRSYSSMNALGASPRQVFALEMVRTALLSVGAALVGVVTAVLVSPVFPLGDARVAEPAPGISLDGTDLVLGAVAVGVVVNVLAVGPAWKSARRSCAVISDRRVEGRAGGRRTPSWLWLRPVTSVGLAMVTSAGRGRSGVPVRTSITALVMAVAGLCAALTFGANLDHVLSTPKLYGCQWAAQVTDLGSAGTVVLVPRLRHDKALSGVALVYSGIPLRVDGSAVDALALVAVKGRLEVTTRSGKRPRGPGEIALGSTTMSELGVRVGQRVRVSIPVLHGPTRVMTVVGSVVVPATSSNGYLGHGAVVTPAGLGWLVPRADGQVPPPDGVFANFASGGLSRAPSRAQLARLGRLVGPEYTVAVAPAPTDIISFGQTQDLPLVMGLLLAGLGAATLGLTLVSSVRRRAMDLAVLKLVGYTPNQVRAVVAVQATTMAGIGLLIGLPLGISVGHYLWAAVANGLGLVPINVVPVGALAAAAVAVLAAANLVAAIPGHVAARVRPAMALSQP